MKKQRVLNGFTFRDPKGQLDYRVFYSVEAAQSGAAFDCDRPYSHISLPLDWHRAYKQGFRIVRAKLVAGASNGAWKELQRGREEMLAKLSEVADFAERNAKAAKLAMDGAAWRAHARKVREAIALIPAQPSVTPITNPLVLPPGVKAGDYGIKHAIDSTQRPADWGAWQPTRRGTGIDHSDEECPNFPGCHCLNHCCDGWKHPSPEDGPPPKSGSEG